VNLFGSFFSEEAATNCTDCPLECESIKYEITKSFTTISFKYYTDLLINCFPNFTAKFQNLSTEEIIAKFKNQILMARIYYEDLAYTLIEESEKTNIADLPQSTSKTIFF
jgi:hypothetical protein